MSAALAWLGLAGATAVGALPSASGVRTVALAGGGRLAVGGSARRGRSVGRWGGPAASARTAVTVVAVLVGVLAVRWGAALGVAAAAASGVVGLLVHDVVTGRARDRARRALQTAIGVLVEELSAGSRPADALSAAAQTWDPAAHRYGDPAGVFAAAADAARRGGDAAAMLVDGTADAMRAIGVAWRLGETTGAALSGVIDRVAAELAAAESQRRAVRVALAGPRSSAALLTGLPVLGILLGLAMGAHPIDFLTGDAAGRALCCAGVLLDAGGVLWIRRIVRKVDPS